MEITYYKQFLYRLDANDEIRIWGLEVIKEPPFAHPVITQYWGVFEGAIQEKVNVITQGKNLGRANETTPLEQALSEAQSIVKKKLDQGYKSIDQDFKKSRAQIREELLVLGKTDASGHIKPMLAQTYGKSKKHFSQYPYHAQPKLDGHRCIAYIYPQNDDRTVELYSRKGKRINLPHIEKELVKIALENELKILDGELYIHPHSKDHYVFQKLTGLIKAPHNYDQLEVEKVQYWVFDIVDVENPWQTRFQIQNDLAREFVKTDCIQITPTVWVKTEKEKEKTFAKFIEEGYEGMMLRDPNAYYEYNKRSAGLLKCKDRCEDEYIIVDVEAADKEPETAVFKCALKNGTHFRVRPQGSYELRQKYLQQKKQLVGKWLTVEYFNLTDDGFPRFPSGKTIRDYE